MQDMQKNMGRQIRSNRLRCGMTQEKLAERLNVSSQAVSKWENGASTPDIMLLPELSAALGITVDQLFESSFETHLRRIENMLDNSHRLDADEYAYAEAHLKEGCLDIGSRGHCLTLLADLMNHRAQMYLDLAADYAKQALALDPDKKANHSALCFAGQGCVWDWCASNHNVLIDYYKGFVEKNPMYAPGYLWLMDNLIIDGRLAEAEHYLEKMRTVRDSYHYELYKGWIALLDGNKELAEQSWRQMTEKYPDEWKVWSSIADICAKRAHYDLAIEYFRKAAQLEQSPRYTDNYESIAQICRITGDLSGAADAYEQVVNILRTDWNMPECEIIQNYLNDIERIRGGAI